MGIVIIFLGLFFTVFSGSILAYISIATMMGPWMAPTIALISNVFFNLKQNLTGSSYSPKNQQTTTLIQAIGSVGGAVATGIGFAFPMLYFLDRPTFMSLLVNPGFFCLFIAGLCLTAGSLGIALGTLYAPSFLKNKDLSFPVSQLTYNVISSQNNRTQAVGIFRGITLAATVSLLRDGIGKIGGIIPKTIHLFTPYVNQEFSIALWPTIWAIGFSGGLSLIAPILLGLLSKYAILFPLNNHANILPISLFQPMNIVSLTVAFCSGIVLSELIGGLISLLRLGIKRIKSSAGSLLPNIRSFTTKFSKMRSIISEPSRRGGLFLTIGILLGTICLLTELKFPPLAQITLLAVCTFATHQICFIGSKIGLIQYGRFSTYILIPMFLLFDLTYLQLTIVCVFFNICAATASDMLFDLKTGSLAQVSPKKMWLAQWVGLIGVTISIGFIFYLLFTNLHLGTPDFFAQRSQAKALLLQTLHFDPFVVFFGFLYGLLVKKCGLSPTMVFGGIIMPNSISIGLIIGASLTLLTKRKEEYLPFCAGVFASESLWVLSSILIKIW